MKHFHAPTIQTKIPSVPQLGHMIWKTNEFHSQYDNQKS